MTNEQLYDLEFADSRRRLYRMARDWRARNGESSAFLNIIESYSEYFTVQDQDEKSER
jgi:hypothetical protein